MPRCRERKLNTRGHVQIEWVPCIEGKEKESRMTPWFWFKEPGRWCLEEMGTREGERLNRRIQDWSGKYFFEVLFGSIDRELNSEELIYVPEFTNLSWNLNELLILKPMDFLPYSSGPSCTHFRKNKNLNFQILKWQNGWYHLSVYSPIKKHNLICKIFYIWQLDMPLCKVKSNYIFNWT